MSSREQRIAANEAAFRDVNERIARAGVSQTSPLEIICECGDADCLERIAVTAAEYERARADPTLFIARTGHIKADVEHIVAEQGDHQLIRKTGDAAVVAEERDPRS
ncbi:MAG TPA: hypothetical protein VGN27_11145 [Gaiellaceae bacterium]|jgi:hypothetical protein|nr:hypothetical protein [Gaiellaceae bacterium]